MGWDEGRGNPVLLGAVPALAPAPVLTAICLLERASSGNKYSAHGEAGNRAGDAGARVGGCREEEKTKRDTKSETVQQR